MHVVGRASWGAAALAAFVVTAALLTPTTARADTEQNLALVTTPEMVFPKDLAVAVDDDGTVAIDVPLGLELSDVVAVTRASDHALVRGTMEQSGNRLVIGFPAGFKADRGTYRFFVTGSSTWPAWKIDGDFTVAFSTTISDDYPAGPLEVRPTGTIRVGAFSAKPGEPHTVHLPAWDAINQAGDTNSALLASVVAGDAGDPESEVASASGVQGNAFNSVASFTLPASLPVDDWPGAFPRPQVRLTYPGRGGVESVRVLGALQVTERVRDQLGVARPTDDGALQFLLPDAGAVRFGRAGDTPLVGDWDGDGAPSVGVYRDGVFLLGSTLTDGGGKVTVVRFGQPGDVPLTGRFDASSSKQTVVLYRPSTATFYVASDNVSGGGSVRVVPFGARGDVPLIGHWGGDEKDTDLPGVYRPSDHTYYLPSTAGTITRAFGSAGDVALSGDLNGNGFDDPVVRRGDSFFSGASMGGLFPQAELAYGRAGDVPFTYTPAVTAP